MAEREDKEEKREAREIKPPLPPSRKTEKAVLPRMQNASLSNRGEKRSWSSNT